MSEPEDNLATLKAAMDRDFKAWMDIIAAAEAEAKAAGKPVSVRNNTAYWKAMQAYQLSQAAFWSRRTGAPGTSASTRRSPASIGPRSRS